MINQGVTAPDREAFEAWFNAFNIKEMPEYQTIRDFSFAAWQAATAAKEAEIAAIKAERDAAMKDAERMKEGLDAVEVLIDNSSGVAGLHLNGDLALWSDLRTGGHFEAWLLAFDEAIDAAMKGTP